MSRMLGTVLIYAAIFWGFVGVSCARSETITNDMGGSVQARLDRMSTMSEARIVGQCYSACTLYLGLPNVCVAPDARLGFHGPSTRSGILLPRAEWDRVSHEMAAHYPPAVRLWFLAEARKVTGRVVVVRGSELIEMGVKECRG